MARVSSVLAHIDALDSKHDSLEQEIRQARRAHASESVMHALKKQRLILEDEIAYQMAKAGDSIHDTV